LTTGRTFRRVLFEVRGDLLVLRNAELIQEDRVVPVEGSVVVERSRVEFVQVDQVHWFTSAFLDCTQGRAC
jgi:hypothetical protein